ncbi:MAG: hypothetical protein AAGA60_31090 [Cyanobacteria bacterium P01_E01_bin.42]
MPASPAPTIATRIPFTFLIFALHILMDRGSLWRSRFDPGRCDRFSRLVGLERVREN